MMGDITIRHCVPEDAEALSALAKRTFYDTFTGTCSEEDMQGFLYEHYDAARMHKALEENAPPTWFALAGNIPVGYLSFAKRPPRFPYDGDGSKAAELIRLYVDKGYHGKGVAQVLMQFCIDSVVQQDCNYLWLNVWEYNFRAQKFYAKYGFQPTAYGLPFPIGLTPQTDQWWAMEVGTRRGAASHAGTK